jgi:molybdopterin converting factor small subunit
VRVEVRLFATLAQAAPSYRAGDPFEVELQDSATLSDVIEYLAISSDSVHLVMLNGRIVHDRLARLHENDRIGLFPPVGGG